MPWNKSSNKLNCFSFSRGVKCASYDSWPEDRANLGGVASLLFVVPCSPLNQALRICLEWSSEAIYFSTHQFELIYPFLNK